MKLTGASLLNAAKTPLFRRIAIILVAFFAAVASLAVLLRMTPGSRLLEIAKEKGYHIPGTELTQQGPVPNIDVCTEGDRLNATSPEIWSDAGAMYSDHLEDKFT